MSSNQRVWLAWRSNEPEVMVLVIADQWFIDCDAVERS